MSPSQFSRRYPLAATEMRLGLEICIEICKETCSKIFQSSESRAGAKMSMRISLIVVGGLGVIVFAIYRLPLQQGPALQQPQMVSRADSTNPDQVAAGGLVYQANCAICHGQDLEGQPNWREALPGGGYPAPPHDGSGHTWRHGDQQLFEAARLGGEASAGSGQVSHMLGFAEVLSAEEIWSTIAYIKSHWPAGLIARQRLVDRANAHTQGESHAGH